MVDTVGFWVARRRKRLWSDDEKRSICLQTTAPDVSVAQVARRHALNANLIFKWLRDPRFAPGAAEAAAQAPCFLPVEIVDHACHTAERHPVAVGQIEVELAGGHRLRIGGPSDPEALARLIRGLSG
jgi:transposase